MHIALSSSSRVTYFLTWLYTIFVKKYSQLFILLSIISDFIVEIQKIVLKCIMQVLVCVCVCVCVYIGECVCVCVCVCRV